MKALLSALMLVDWINTQRAGKGLGRLRVSAVLGTAAAAHACDMAGRGFFAHNGPGGPSFQARLKRAGYRFSAAVENIAKSRSASAGTAEGIWRKSPAHWGNILNGSIHDIGVAVATDGAARPYPVRRRSAGVADRRRYPGHVQGDLRVIAASS